MNDDISRRLAWFTGEFGEPLLAFHVSQLSQELKELEYQDYQKGVMLEHRGYQGLIFYDIDLDAWLGSIQNTSGQVTFASRDFYDLQRDFATVVDRYLATMAKKFRSQIKARGNHVI